MGESIVMGGEGSTWKLPGAPVGARLDLEVRDRVTLAGAGFPVDLQPGRYVAERLVDGWRVTGFGVGRVSVPGGRLT